MSKVLKPIHAYEQLTAIDSETHPTKKASLLKEFGAGSPLSYILSLNFNRKVQLDLPEGMPALDVKDMDMQTHPDFMGLLGGSISRLRHCMIQSDLKRSKKEQIFYEVLINCPMKDAEILCSAKDEALEELFPTITAEFVKTVFPDYVLGMPEAEKKDVE